MHVSRRPLFQGLPRRVPQRSNYAPSTTIMFAFAVRWRILRGSRYSAQYSQSFARCIDSNSSTTIRFGFQSPSSTSVRPPRTMYLPPFYGRTGKLLVLFVTSRIEDIDFNNHVGGHGSEVRNQRSEIKSQRPAPRSFAANSGIFFRRRSRSQLFQVLRRLSRGVWYFWVSSLLLMICASTPFTEKSSVFTIV